MVDTTHTHQTAFNVRGMNPALLILVVEVEWRTGTQISALYLETEHLEVKYMYVWFQAHLSTRCNF